MKKIILIFLCFLFTFSFTACAPSFKEPSVYESLPNSYNVETDFPVTFFASMKNAIVPAEDGYYIYDGQFVSYFDRESSVVAPLCNRPECAHSDESCSAYFPATSRWLFMQYYEGALYLEAGESDADGYTASTLYRVNPQECTREKICQLPYDWTVHHSYMMHRGYLYMTAVDSVDCIYTFSRVALNELAEKSLTPEVIYQEDSVAYAPPHILGNYIYLRNAVVDKENPGYVNVEWKKVNLKSLEVSELAMPGMSKDSYMNYENSYHDRVIATYVDETAYLRDDYSTVYYSYDPETETYEPFVTLKDRKEGVYDLYAYDGTNHLTFYYAGNTLNSVEKQEFRVLNENFETKKSIALDGNINSFIAGDEDFSFYDVFEENSGFNLYAIDKRGEELKIVKVFE